MTAHFFYGTLCHPDLLAVVLGRKVVMTPAVLPGHTASWVAGAAFPMIAKGGAGVEGCLVAGLGDEDIARLDFYEGGFGYQTRALPVKTNDGCEAMARIYFPDEGSLEPGAVWDLSVWAARWAPTAVETARDFMVQYGQRPPEALRRRYPQMLVRGGARVRAGRLRDNTENLRRQVGAEDVATQAIRHPYAAYFAIEEHQLSFRRFDGSMSAVLDRAVFVSGDAAIVLPYDPVRDRVMVIEQFRAGPHVRGDANPWLIEAIAGRIDGGETPEEAARREAVEEAGLELQAIHAGPSYYPSPAAKAEYLYSFIGIADLPDAAAGLGGLEAEAEDIRSHVISFDHLMALVASGEVDNAPLLILAYWLQSKRAELRAGL